MWCIKIPISILVSYENTWYGWMFVPKVCVRGFDIPILDASKPMISHLEDGHHRCCSCNIRIAQPIKSQIGDRWINVCESGLTLWSVIPEYWHFERGQLLSFFSGNGLRRKPKCAALEKRVSKSIKVDSLPNHMWIHHALACSKGVHLHCGNLKRLHPPR